MDTVDRAIVNTLQEGFPVCDQPFARVAGMLDLTEDELINRLQILLDDGVLSRFGPLFHTERMGGCVTLGAMKVPKSYLRSVTRVVNSFPEVAHNYERTHEFNIWFVVAAETSAAVDEAVAGIEQQTGFPVYNMPKEREYFVGLKFNV